MLRVSPGGTPLFHLPCAHNHEATYQTVFPRVKKLTNFSIACFLSLFSVHFILHIIDLSCEKLRECNKNYVKQYMLYSSSTSLKTASANSAKRFSSDILLQNLVYNPHIAVLGVLHYVHSQGLTAWKLQLQPCELDSSLMLLAIIGIIGRIGVPNQGRRFWSAFMKQMVLTKAYNTLSKIMLRGARTTKYVCASIFLAFPRLQLVEAVAMFCNPASLLNLC